MAKGIGHDDPAFVTAGRLILVPVLESLQLVPVTLSEIRGAWLYMDVVHVARTIGEAGDGVEQRGTDEVTDLKTGVVFAMAEGRQFSEALVASLGRTEFLRKDRVGNADILELVAAVSDARDPVSLV